MSTHAARCVRALKGNLGRFRLAVLAECLAEAGSSVLLVERYPNVRREKGVAVISRHQADGSVRSGGMPGDLYDQIHGTIFYRFHFALAGLTERYAGELVLAMLDGGTARRSRACRAP